MKIKRTSGTARVRRLIRPKFKSATRRTDAVWLGSTRPDILFVVDPMVGRPGADEPPNAKTPIGSNHLEFLTECCKQYNIPLSRCAITRAAPPVTAETWDSDKRTGDHIRESHEEFYDNVIASKPRLIVAMGKASARQVFNKATQITKVRGVPVHSSEYNCNIFPMLGIGHVMRVPDVRNIFNSDMATLEKIIDAGYSLDYQTDNVKDYQWCTDLKPYLDRANAGEKLLFSADIEGVGLQWFKPETKILTVQLSERPDQAIAIPINYNHLDESEPHDKCPPPPRGQTLKLIAQLKVLLEHPNVAVFGHNFKFDYIMLWKKLGIQCANWIDDTICLLHAIDENMLNKSLADGTRIYIPSMAGYSDVFDRDPIHEKKSRMDKVCPNKMLMYGCGDTDATYQLRHTLIEELRKDKRAFKCYRTVVMPALRAFAKIEDHGFTVDKKALQEFEKFLRAYQKEEYRKIIKLIPKTIRDEELGERYQKRIKGSTKRLPASLTRPGFLRAMLFDHADGLQIDPIVFTKSTKNLKDHSQRVPSTSAKQHLAYFKDDHEFVARIIEYAKNEKLLGTYVGTEDGDTIKGFYKYIYDGRIRPTYLLHRTVTGRCLDIGSRVITNKGAMSLGQIRDHLTGSDSPLLVLTHGNRFKRVTEFVRNGRRRTYRVTTLSGKEIVATSNHPFWTNRGWVNLADLRPGDQTFGFDFDYENDDEEWRVCSRHANYEVSNLGRVRSLGSKYKKPGILSPYPKGQWGHVQVALGRGNYFPVHVLVAEAFHGTRPDGYECLHLNGIPADNRSKNLRWGTSKENSELMVIQGRSRRGERSNQVKLTDAQIVEAQRLREAGAYYGEIANRFEVSETLIRFVLQGKRRQPYVSPFLDETIGLIEDAGERWTYDISVEEDHSFIAEGFVVHNTASADPNGQNFPKRGKLAKQYRRVFRAPKGYVYLEVDFSQLELRIAAILANDPTMLELYRKGADIHAATAAAVMGISLEEFNELDADTKAMKRFQAKAVNFGFLYGMGWRKFITYAKTEYDITFSDEEAQQIQSAFFRLYYALKPWHNATRDYVRANGFVRSLDGRVRHLPNVNSDDEALASSAERMAINSPVQGFGSDLGLIALARLVDLVDFKIVRPIGFIHDAIVCLVPRRYAKQAAMLVKQVMETLPLEEMFGLRLPIPIVADASVGETLADTIEIDAKWLQDDNVITFEDIREKDWQARAAKAKARGDDTPAKPWVKMPRKKLLARPGRAAIISAKRKLTIHRSNHGVKDEGSGTGKTFKLRRGKAA